MNNYPPEYFEEEEEIDIVGLLKYLWSNVIPILAMGFAPVFLFLLGAFFTQKVTNQELAEVVVKLERNLPDFNPSSLTSESLLTSVTEEKDWEIEPQNLLRSISIMEGYPAMNEEIDNLLVGLADETSIRRGVTLESIQSKYNNLLALQSNYLTLSINLKQSGIDYQTARVLLTELVEAYNEQFAAGLIPNNIVLSPVNLEDLNNLAVFSTYNVNNFQGILLTLEEYISRIQDLEIGRLGFNKEIIENRLNYLDYELRMLIASDPQMQSFFFEELDRVIEIQSNKITSIENALRELAKGKQPLSSGANENNNYSTELFDRFLDLGATVSQIEFQKELLQTKLDLEFDLAKLIQRREKLQGIPRRGISSEAIYANLIAETQQLGTIINDFILAYNENYQAKILNIIQLRQTKTGSIITVKTTGIILVLSLGLALFVFILKRSFSEKKEVA